jgi:hypothetical protein
VTPDTHPFDVVYVLAQVGWTALIFVVAPLLLIVGWQRVERRIHAKRATTVYSFPRRDADVIELYPNGRGGAA